MSDIPPIISQEDYDRTRRNINADVAIARTQSLQEGWDPIRAINAAVEAELPYYKVMTDPATPHVSLFALKEDLNASDGKVRLLTREENPDIYKTLDRETAELNAQYGTDYKAPRVTVVEGLAADYGGTPLRFDNRSDAVQIDAGYFETFKADPQAAAALLGHELSHRYQRSDAELRAVLQTLEGNASSNNYEVIRGMEIEADRNAAVLTSPKAMARALDQSYDAMAQDPDSIARQNYQNTLQIGFETANASYNMLSDENKAKEIEKAMALPENQRVALGKAYEANEKALEVERENEDSHPSYEARMNALLGGFKSPTGVAPDHEAPAHDAAGSASPNISSSQQATRSNQVAAR